MTTSQLPSESELMKQAWRSLQRVPKSETLQRARNTEDERVSDDARDARRNRSLKSCHRPGLMERPRYDPPRESGSYVPELSARLDDDRNLTDGARRCARKIAELTYRSNREGRTLDVTVTYLVKALGRCRRSVQRYLRLLEEGGYITADVVKGTRSRMCVGLLITLCAPLFPRHHKEKWPGRVKKPGATQESQNQRVIDSFKAKGRVISRHDWTRACMDGVFRSLMKTLPSFDLVIPTPQ
ncbi:MAG: hypothetical protein AB7I36_19810 [Rhodospirillaceae bacterium]